MSDRFTTNGAFSWSELLTSDVEGAKKFYGDLLGWETEDMPMEGMDYTEGSWPCRLRRRRACRRTGGPTLR